MSDKKSTFLREREWIGDAFAQALNSQTSVEVPAGTFNAYKLQAEPETQLAFSTVCSWYNVKENGKLEGSAALEASIGIKALVKQFKNQKVTEVVPMALREAMDMKNLISSEKFCPSWNGDLSEKLETWLKYNVKDASGRTYVKPSLENKPAGASWKLESYAMLLELPASRLHSRQCRIEFDNCLRVLLKGVNFGKVELDKAAQFWRWSKSYDDKFGANVGTGKIFRDADDRTFLESFGSLTIYPAWVGLAKDENKDEAFKIHKRQVTLWLKKAIRENLPLIFVKTNQSEFDTRQIIIDVCNELQFKANIKVVSYDKVTDDVNEYSVKTVEIIQVPLLFRSNVYFRIHQKDKSIDHVFYDLNSMSPQWVPIEDINRIPFAICDTIDIVHPDLLKEIQHDKVSKTTKIVWTDAYLQEFFKDKTFGERLQVNVFMDTFGDFVDL